MELFYFFLFSLILCYRTSGQDSSSDLPSTWPNYTGAPSLPFSRTWQSCKQHVLFSTLQVLTVRIIDFEVNSSAISNVSFTLPTSYAGNLPVNRKGHPNNTLFFWATEKSFGSLNDDNPELPYLIWLQGG